MKLKDKISVVTGGASGIGRAIALAFAQEGARVIVADIDTDGGKETVEMIKKLKKSAFFVEADVAESASVKNLAEKTIERYGCIDIMVNNAGIEVFQRLAETDEAMWDRVIAVNLRGVFLGTKYAVPHMLKNGGGAVINMASVAGIMGAGGLAAYNASKGGVVLLTRNTAMDYGRKGIRANCICPGFIATPMVTSIMAMPGADAVKGQVIGLCPAGRLGKPEEVARCAVFLASDDASFVNGHALVVDGGMSAGWEIEVEKVLGG
ncbi:MAG: SDR family oxidoreductase [Candidatus Abyssobacteria bacterium SURF_17]|uniref:SDR family oxidoreductase n=1 Tax=Candidatus Abyssobacteria bacterium SURF_17 TaxID=2093361 RepID=A0A419ESA4_9BACT|nr:MAG: SDR family oxidoreductase [Candidatus Abyssubacteria bacterium SURF_17]